MVSILFVSANKTLEALPKICPIVKIGTAAFIQKMFIKTGGKTNAPPNPSALEIVAAINDAANNIINSIVK